MSPRGGQDVNQISLDIQIYIQTYYYFRIQKTSPYPKSFLKEIDTSNKLVDKEINIDRQIEREKDREGEIQREKKVDSEINRQIER